jgi:hypothetical protein
VLAREPHVRVELLACVLVAQVERALMELEILGERVLQLGELRWERGVLGETLAAGGLVVHKSLYSQEAIIGASHVRETPTVTQSDVVAVLSKQRRHQLRVHRERMTWWVPWIFVVGLGVSILGLIPSIAAFRADGSQKVSVAVFALFSVLFGWAVPLWLIGPFLLSPRIVPYFSRELGAYGGETMAAFRRGRGLYREIVALEQLARSLGVIPLAAFGFAYDHYDQTVQWHPAPKGLETVEALRHALGAHAPTAPDVALDLESLSSVLRTAADQGVEFSLVLRLYAKDDMQAVCTREARQGSFW